MYRRSGSRSRSRTRIIILLLLIGVIFVLSRSIYSIISERRDEQEVFVPYIEEEIEEEIDEEKEIEIYKYTKENLNLRSGPGTDYEVIVIIPKGEKVLVISSGDGWDKLDYKGEIGYSSQEYLIQSGDEDSSHGDDDLEMVVSPETMKIVNGILLVNKEYALPMGYDPGEDPEALEYLNKMMAACLEETGEQLTAYSGYRSYEYQKSLFNRYAEKDGYDKAVMYSAKPRHSEHESGLAYDIGGRDQSYWLKEAFENTEEGIWLRDNAHRFGYILRYPKGKTHITGYIYEPWHFRYIGIEDARNVYEEDLTLEEYLLGDI